MQKLILIVLLLVAIGYLYEAYRRRRQKAQQQSTPGNETQSERLTAADVGPTESGRFRVQEMLQQTTKYHPSQPPPLEDNEEETLPDPFFREDPRKK